MAIGEAILVLKQTIEDAVETFIRSTSTTVTDAGAPVPAENINVAKLREEADRFINGILQLYGVCIQTVAIIQTEAESKILVDNTSKLESEKPEASVANRISEAKAPDKFPCPHCDKSYAFERNLIEHLRYHDDPSAHICRVCRIHVKSQRNLTVHMQIHAGVKPFACPEPGCQRSYNRASSLRDHLRRHLRPGTFDYVCEVCGRGFYTKNDYKKHCKVHGTAEERRRFKCTFEGCKDSFTAKAHLQTHIVVHTGERPHKCKRCGMDFKHLSTLHKHQKAAGKCKP